jgi:glycosyltransferase involved in cell wall biosynthesis
MLLYGNFARKMMIEMGFNSRRLYVVHNSLDYDAQSKLRESVPPETLNAIRSEYFSQPELPLLVFVGRLTLAKKLHMILGAMEILTQNEKLVNTLFIGDGPAKEDLEQMVRQKGLEQHVAFYGACYEETELAPMIMAADACVSPGFVGLTAMHSLAYGTPIITHGCPENQSPEFEAVVEGKSGSFFQENDTEDMARVIEAWLDRGKSRDEIRRSCYEIIEKYYNPNAQTEIINAAVAGIRSADELPLGEGEYVVTGQ